MADIFDLQLNNLSQGDQSLVDLAAPIDLGLDIPVPTQSAADVAAFEAAQPEEKASKFRDFALKIGARKGSLLNALSGAFGQGTEEIAARRRTAINSRLADRVAQAEGEAKIKALGRGAIETDVAGRKRFVDSGQPVFGDVDTSVPTGAAGRDFALKLKDLSPEDAEKATRISLGLDPRAIGAAAKTVLIGGVPHIFDPVTKEFIQAKVRGQSVTAKTVGASAGEVAAGTERGRGAGKLVAKTVAAGSETIGKIKANLLNVDRAIAAIDRGASSGVINSFFPSFKEATILLENAQKNLGLDVVGAVTFGALSKGELDLALQAAIPTDLQPAPLREFLVRRKEAQTKLSDYYLEQINFLDDGGTVPEFLREKKGEPPLPAGLPAGSTDNGDGTFTLPDGKTRVKVKQ